MLTSFTHRPERYEGNCTVTKPGVLEQYRYQELVLKRKAWMKETNKPPRQCAIEFEAKIRSLDPKCVTKLSQKSFDRQAHHDYYYRLRR